MLSFIVPLSGEQVCVDSLAAPLAGLRELLDVFLLAILLHGVTGGVASPSRNSRPLREGEVNASR